MSAKTIYPGSNFHVPNGTLLLSNFLRCIFSNCRLLKKFDFPSMKFTLYFMGFEDASDIPKDEKERTVWLFSRKATLELTQ